MQVKLDVCLSFPIDAYAEPDYARLVKYCGSVEDVEQNFEIEFSCGDGKYLSDYWCWTEGGALCANWPDNPEGDEELAKYDGRVCTNTPPRLNVIKLSMNKETMKVDKLYRFVVKYIEKTEEDVFYINGRERSRRFVG